MVVWRGESPTGEVGEVGSFAPDESFVRFFFRNPRVGMRRLAGECGEGWRGAKSEMPGSMEVRVT